MVKKSRVDESREPGRYIALPTAVIDSPAYQNLSHTAKALLIEVARQRSGGDNGRMLLSQRYLASRGWRSGDVIQRAKRELLAAKLIYETVQGHRPNKASWYALTWYSLDKLNGYDDCAADGFRRGMYASMQLPAPPPTREALFEKWRGHGATGQKKPSSKKIFTPSHGVERAAIAPPHGVESGTPTPSHGAIRGGFDTPPTPSHGDPLDIPFCAAESLHLATAQPTEPTPQTEAQMPAIGDDIDGDPLERIREHDLDPTRFDPTTGEFCRAPAPPARKQKRAADRWVATALADQSDSTQGA
ncbi:MAG: hypothetical protein Q7T69_05865 [Rhodoferax sp.]|nr:hypothetical protein [Rhodoferax sp.]